MAPAVTAGTRLGHGEGARLAKLLAVNSCRSSLPWTSGACCKSKTGRHNQDRSRCATNHKRILMRPVLIVATGLGFATSPWCISSGQVAATGLYTSRMTDQVVSSVHVCCWSHLSHYWVNSNQADSKPMHHAYSIVRERECYCASAVQTSSADCV